MPIPIWAGHYIGLRFKEHGRDISGVDCWGLVRLVLAEQFGIALPSYIREYETTTEVDCISRLIEREAIKWRLIKSGDEICGDVIVMRVRGKPMHVGLVLGDRQMLHIEHGINSVIESYTSSVWSNRISGFYRYKNPLDLNNDSFTTYKYD